ncbi:phage tail assembly chaperone [Erythrobacter sp. R86502]|uniref:phage tail assembly chaperone n=1 Tax=Erythrobacter sp. R86502 TaxID=3093846 RepID=UPI0036D2B564
MTPRFADASARWCALASQQLGWRPAEFWSATPAELAMALTAPDDLNTPPPPSREMIAQMMERDAND